MMMVIAALMVLPAAFVIDLFLGDPPRLPHPVRWMGRSIEYGEPIFRKWLANDVRAGLAFALSMVLLVWIVTSGCVYSAHRFHPALGWSVEVILIAFALSTTSLRQAAAAVHRALKKGTLNLAKQRVAMIVGRDADGLSRQGVIRATVETVSENLVDGVMSPVFYAAIGGAPLAMAFKMVSTLDSMVGYKTPQYRDFGKASARLDDLANFIPARLSIPVIAVAAQILFGSGRRSWRTAICEGGRHSSPNAGKPEAAFAGALALKLGGPNSYHGTLVDKPFIGTNFGAAERHHIPQACELMFLSAFLWTLGCWTCSSLYTVLAV